MAFYRNEKKTNGQINCKSENGFVDEGVCVREREKKKTKFTMEN